MVQHEPYAIQEEKDVNLFSIRDFNLWYGSVQALKDVSLDIFSHSITAFIGPSGCGKSTFIRSLNRMNDVIDSVRVSGTVLYEGQDIYSGYDPMQLRKRVGMVFQKPNPFPMSIYDNIAFGVKVFE